MPPPTASSRANQGRARIYIKKVKKEMKKITKCRTEKKINHRKSHRFPREVYIVYIYSKSIAIILSKLLLFHSSLSESEMRSVNEARLEDTESLSSTATSDTSSKNARSDTLQSKAKSKAVKNFASLPQTRSV